MAKAKLLQTIIDISGEMSPTLGKSLDDLAGKFEGVKGKALLAGAAAGGIAVGVAAGIGKAVVALGKLGNEYNMALNDISAGTGMVGDELEEMSDILKNVYSAGLGESMEDVAAGVTAVYQATGLTGEALEATAKGAFVLAETFGYDVTESARAAKAMIQNFGVTGDEALSLIAAGAQNGLDYSGELIDSISEYSVQFKKLGFSADEMFQVFQNGADSGAWNLDKIGDAVKEFSIRSVDGSKTTSEAFTALGMDANEMMAIFAKGGPDAQKAFKKVVKALISVEDQVERDAIGVKLFGTMWEDLGVDAVKSLAEIDEAAYDTNDALQQISEVKFDNLGDAFESIKRKLEVAFLPLAQMIADAVMEVMPIITDLIDKIMPVIEQLTAEVGPIITQVLTKIVEIIEMLIPYVMDFIEDLGPILSDVTNNFFEALEPILPALGKLIQSLLPFIVAIIESLVPILEMITDTSAPIVELILELVAAILPVLTELIKGLTPVIRFLCELITNVLNGAIEGLSPAFEGLISILGYLAEFISNVFAGDWEAAWNSIVDIFAGCFLSLPLIIGSIINSIIEIINGVIEGINYIGEFTGWGQIELIPTIDLDEFSWYAKGGFTDGISIAGEEGTEAIISFNPAYRQDNLAYWAEAGRMLGATHSDYDLSGTETGGVYYDMGGISFAPSIVIHGDASKQTIMEAIEEEYPDFLDMLEEYLNRRGAAVYG